MTALETELAGAGGSIAQLEDEISSISMSSGSRMCSRNARRADRADPRQGSELQRHRARQYSDDNGSTGTADKGG